MGPVRTGGPVSVSDTGTGRAAAGTWSAAAPSTATTTWAEAAEPAPEPGQPGARRRLRRRLAGHRDRRHVGAHRLRAAGHRQRRHGVRLRHGVAADPHGGRARQHLLPRRQRPARHPHGRRHPDPAADRGAVHHQHPARRRSSGSSGGPPSWPSASSSSSGATPASPRRRSSTTTSCRCSAPTPHGQGRRWLIARVVARRARRGGRDRAPGRGPHDRRRAAARRWRRPRRSRPAWSSSAPGG